MYCVVIVNILNVCSENVVPGKFHNNTVIQLSFPTLMRLIRGFVGMVNSCSRAFLEILRTCIKEGLDR